MSFFCIIEAIRVIKPLNWQSPLKIGRLAPHGSDIFSHVITPQFNVEKDAETNI